MSQRTDNEHLPYFTELMNRLLPVYDVPGDPQPSVEERQGLLRDIRSVRDTYAQDRTRLENQLLAAQQTVHALKTQLGIADQKLVSLEDLIGEVRTRMQNRGLHTRQPVRRPFPSPETLVPAIADGVTSTQPPPCQPEH